MKHTHVLVLAIFSFITITTTACIEPPAPTSRVDQGQPMADMPFADMPSVDMTPSLDMVTGDMAPDLPAPPEDMTTLVDEGMDEDTPPDLPDAGGADMLDMPDASDMPSSPDMPVEDMESCDANAERMAFCQGMSGARRCGQRSAVICGTQQNVDCGMDCALSEECNEVTNRCCDPAAERAAKCQANYDAGFCGTIMNGTLCGEPTTIECARECKAGLCCGNGTCDTSTLFPCT